MGSGKRSFVSAEGRVLCVELLLVVVVVLLLLVLLLAQVKPAFMDVELRSSRWHGLQSGGRV